ncbi:HFL212Wp [Eremothecium sinecaudum]|uniref:Presequence protease, mitochondrial n=1 Tax=Eremothecium sinecaudum TaxID=45286 RepID=A0A0X8HUB4_9SACH|nr:HFL212Wp [Eremothecium sinecaudum]AMD21644.1 HFL212Wp [Eremothecium sinecaudum]
MLRFRRALASYSRDAMLRRYPLGKKIHDFEIKRVLPVPELSLTCVDLVHNKTGAEHLHIDRDDKNNVFSIGFKTNPPDATGVPHILEHTSLCGSKKYPVRDPFFKMLNRTLSNFMNAMTGHDYIFYPFATTNKKDFGNLRKLYLDATLNPLLKKEDFLQEGWRLEHSDMDNKNSDIVFKGVVYNEMKGQVSNADYYYWIKFQESIYPSLNNSGGDPEKITDLRYEDLVNYHKRHFHPSNAKTFSYGNISVEDTLEELSNEFLNYSKMELKKQKLTPINLSSNIEVELPCQPDPMLPVDKQKRMSLTWICGKPEDTYETFLLKMLGSLLFDGHSSPFYKGLIEKGLGYSFSVNTGVESQTAVNFLTVGVSGCDDISEVRKTILDIFNEAIKTPFEKDRIEAIMHQIELSKKDQKSDFGLQLLYGIIPGWVNNIDPFDAISIKAILDKFREQWSKEGDKLFKDLLLKHVIDKPFFQFSMIGEESFSKELESKEQKRLEEKKKTLTQAEEELIYANGLHLQKLQNSEQDLSLLPTLHVSDIPREANVFSISVTDNIRSRITDTNGITYIRGKRSLNDILPYELYPFLPLFAESLTSLGTGTEEYYKIEEQIKLRTGGINAAISVTSNPVDCSPELQLEFSGWSLNGNTQYVFDLLKKLLCDTNFANKEKLKVLIKSLASSNTASVAESGHSYARSYSSAYFYPSRAISESLSGVEQLKFHNGLTSLLDDEERFQKEVSSKLQQIKDKVISSDNMKFMVTTDSSQMLNTLKSQIENFTVQLPNSINHGNQPLTASFPLMSKPGLPTLIKFPFQVHYAAQTLKGVPYVHEDGAPLQVLANLLTFKHLHREIREKGGAYGGGAAYSAVDGVLNFYSYRDPNPLNTLSTFDNIARYALQDSHWSQDDLNEAKLTIFQKVDAPVSVRSEGSAAFYYNITDEMRQKRREGLLDVSIDDVHRVASKYLVDNPPTTRVSAVVGPEIPGVNWPVTEL